MTIHFKSFAKAIFNISLGSTNAWLTVPFETTFVSSDEMTLDTTRPDENYFNTIADLDANDDITWGEWSIPLKDVNGVYTDREYFVAGIKTAQSKIGDYKNGSKFATYKF